MSKSNKYVMTPFDKLISVYLFIGAVIELFILIFNNDKKIILLVYLGYIFCIISLLLFLSSNILKIKGGMVERKGYVTTKLVDSGIYGIIRHPIYLSLAYLFLGLALLTHHPISLFFGITMGLICYYFMISEEKLTTDKFGEDFLLYMEKVPRSNLLIGCWRYLKRKF